MPQQTEIALIHFYVQHLATNARRPIQPSELPGIKARLLAECEAAKKTMSGEESATMFVLDLLGSQDFEMEVNRDTFVQLNQARRQSTRCR